jgi:putative sterol carrier protein
MPELSIQDWLDKLEAHFAPEMAEGVDGKIQLHLSGEGGGDWFVTIRNQKISYSAGQVPDPRVTLSGSATDVLKVLSRQMDGMRAYMTGKLKIKGDTGFAMRLVKLFRE